MRWDLFHGVNLNNHRKFTTWKFEFIPAGSVETFFQDNPALVAPILKGIQSTKVFATDIITIAGDYSLTTFVASRVNRVDLITEDLLPWKHPDDILDVVELSEDEFRERSHLNDPARLERRRSPKQTGEFAVVFVEVEMTGGTRYFWRPKSRWDCRRNGFSGCARCSPRPRSTSACVRVAPRS